MEIAQKDLAKYGTPLASNQVQINLLHRKIEASGVPETARELGITLIAYVPLRSGMLTGKSRPTATWVTQAIWRRQAAGRAS
jgi:aryl-alcohol dehydrogenase-like predicted oxidoreductase